VNLVIVPSVPWRNGRINLQILDKEIYFGVLQPFLVRNLEPIWYNEERKNGSFLFILPRKSISNHILIYLPVNYLIIISKYLGDPFLLLWGGNSLFQKINEALMISFNLEALAQ
jgi:hypothetical protein